MKLRWAGTTKGNGSVKTPNTAKTPRRRNSDPQARHESSSQDPGSESVTRRKIGYARVSTDEQSLGLQISALAEAGCEQVFEDHGVSGAKTERPGLEAAIAALKSGDVFVVWRLDRLGRSLTHLVQVVNELGARGVEFHSLSESIDTTSSGGRLIFHIMAALAEFERSLISERTRAGMQAAQKRGKHVGRPASLTDEQVSNTKRRIENGETLKTIASDYNVHPRTIVRALRHKAAEK